MIQKLLDKVKIEKSATKFFVNTGWLVFDKIFHMGLSLVITAMMSRY